jgi:hypothetical protein
MYLVVIEIIVILCLNAIPPADKVILCNPIDVNSFCSNQFCVITVIVALSKISYLLLYYSLWTTEKIFELTENGATLLNNENEPFEDYRENQRISRIRISALPFSYPQV